MKRGLLFLCTFCFLLPGATSALMPPEDMAKRNLEAKLILIGDVKGTGIILLPEKGSKSSPKKGIFILNVLHVVKGYGTVKRGDQVHIIFRPALKPKEGLVAHKAGSGQVMVEAGNLVVVYIEPSKHGGFYRPIAEGSSVVVIAP
jgi:hypothetical protein